MGTTKDAERKILLELTGLLLKNAEKVLEGDTKVCLTTTSLEILVSNFRRYSEKTEDDTGETSTSREQKRHATELKKWKDSIRTLIDFVLKIKALKIINTTYTMKAPIQIARFSSLQVLEVKKVPIHMLEGLSKLRGQLKELIVSRSLEELQGVLEVCGGDRASGLVWSCLTVAFLGFNGLEKLDDSLRLVPFLEVLDLSHNNLKETGDFLMSLTDVVKISLGYNLLSSVPKLSLTNKIKLRTLVLRNNSLDNLDGVEEITMLEELDVSENCFVDHKVLHVLAGLNRLRVLFLTGNPLCYKTNHRHLTLKKLSPQTAMIPIAVDGQKLAPNEISIVQQNQFIKRSSVLDDHTHDEEDGMETIVVSHGRGSISGNRLHPNHEKNKKRGHKRIHSKERVPAIGNIQDSMDDAYASSDVSPTHSYKEESDLMAEVEKDKMRYEILREHYKDDWLKALSAEQGRYDKKSGEAARDITETDGGEGSRDQTVTGTTDAKSEEGTRTVSAYVTESPNEDVPAKSDDEHKISGSPFSPIHIVETTDIYARMASTQVERRASPVPVLTISHVDVEEKTTDNEEQYGNESEPFIVMLPIKDMKQIFVTVNNRYIIEKGTDGKKLESLDLKWLQRAHKKTEELSGKDIVGPILFTVMTLDFDYVKKDMRQRKYAMEDDNDALIFESLIYPHLKAKEEQGKIQMECLRCKHQFSQQSTDDTGLKSCPSCKSKMVIRSDQAGHEGANGQGTKTEASLSTGHESRNTEQEETVILRHSPIVQRKKQSTQKGGTSDSSQRIQSSTFEGSLSDYVDKLIPDDNEGTKDKTDRRRGFYSIVEDGSQPDIMEKSASSSDLSTHPQMKSNNSWSDVRTSANSRSMTRSSISSVDSDITVLTTNSRGSVSVISESSHETIDKEQLGSTNRTEENVEKDVLDLSDQIGVRRRTESVEVTSLPLGKSPQVLTTPVGSPLSNSVCSSMVSSVYENTLSGGGEEPVTGRGDSRNNTLDTSSLTGSSSDSVSFRQSSDSSDTRSRRSKHRNVTVYMDETEHRSDQSDSKLDANRSGEVTGEASSIYDTAKSRQDISSLNSTTASVDKSFPSIYDKKATGSDSEKPDNSNSFLSVTRRSHDNMTTNQESSSHSSPRKSSRNRSRSRSANRRATYGDSFLDQGVDSPDTSGLPEFPSDLSPIKKVPNQQSTNQTTAEPAIDQSEVGTENVVLRNKTDSSMNATTESGSTGGSSILPWDLEEKVKAAKHESLIHDEFINIDHRIQLYLELKVLKAEEQIQCAIKCIIVQYMMPKEVKSLLVISSQRILIFRIEGDLESNSSDWLSCYEDQPITELQYIDIGLGYQSLRLEFSTLCSSYTLLICDEARCKQFLTLLSDIVQTAAIHEHSKLEGISKSNPVTMENLQSEVLEGAQGAEEDEEEEEGPQQLVRYLMVRYMEPDLEEDEGKILGLVITANCLVLVRENHQWPLPRLQVPLSLDVKGQQFTVLQREKINNIETFVFNEYDPKELRLTFFENTDADAASVWYITMETNKGVKSLVDAIRDPWEEEFGVTLDVTSKSFAED